MTASTLLCSLKSRLPDQDFSTDDLDLYASDVVYEADFKPLAVVKPTSPEEVQELVAAACALGFSVAARGGGLSYSKGYLPTNPTTVVVDLTEMNRIIELNAQDRYVTVEAGVTWAQLREALKPHGLTTPFWGTFSGAHATVGGTVAQNGKFYGSASRGSSAESVIGLKLVTGTGELLVTGSGASAEGCSPFFRNFGPDLTGIFLGDCGALGIKVEITLQLIPAAEELAFCTFSFDDPQAQMRAMAEIGSELLATECQGMDPFTAQARLQSEGLTNDISTLLRTIRNSGGLFAGLQNGFTIALNGRRFVKNIGYLMNTVCEGRVPHEAKGKQARVRAIARKYGGREIPSSIPRVLRAIPFPPVGSLLTPSGKRMFWLHTMVPNSLGAECFRVTEAVFEKNRAAMKAAGIDRGYLLSTHGPTAVGVETILRWSDAPYPIHTHYMSEGDPPKIRARERNPEGRAVLEDIAAEILEAWRALSGVHVQIGRKYPFMETRLPATADFLKTLKATLDPHGVLNPGNIFDAGNQKAASSS